MEVWAISDEDFQQSTPQLRAGGQGEFVLICGYECFELKRSYRPAVLVNTRIPDATFSDQQAEASRIRREICLQLGL